MQNIFRINILLASPGNLSDDRKKVSDVVKNINLDSGLREGFSAEIVSWETHSRPAAGDEAQAVLNDQFPEDIDIFIGMMGTYFGTPTKRWGSGTEEEFRIAYERWKSTQKPEIMFYFSDAMSSIRGIDTDQLAKRNAFQKEIEKLGIYYFTYSNIAEFQFDLLRHISFAIHKVLEEKEIGRSQEAIPEESVDSLNNYRQLLANDPLVNANTMFHSGAEHMNAFAKLLLSVNNDVTKLMNRLLKESRLLDKSMKNGNQRNIEKSINSICKQMGEYSDELILKIPKISNEFSESIILVLRAINMIRDNNLEDNMPFDVFIPTISPVRDSLIFLVKSIVDVEGGFREWPDDVLDMKIQKQLILALHKDLIDSLNKSIELLDRLAAEFG